MIDLLGERPGHKSSPALGLLIHWKFRDDISNGSGVIMLTNTQTDTQTDTIAN